MFKSHKPQNFDGMVDGNDGANPTPNEVDDLKAAADQEQRGLMVFGEDMDLGQDDIIIPRLRLAQGLTAEVQDGTARAGQWVLIGFDPLPEATIVPLRFARRREMRDEDTREILCATRDTKAELGVGSPGGACAQCPYNKWTGDEKAGERRAPPACSFSYNYLVYIVEHGTKAMMSFSRTSIGAGKMLNTMVAQHGLGNVAIKLAAKSKDGPRGTYYSPAVSRVNVEPSVLELARTTLAS